jgi:hypothetical protein
MVAIAIFCRSYAVMPNRQRRKVTSGSDTCAEPRRCCDLLLRLYSAGQLRSANWFEHGPEERITLHETGTLVKTQDMFGVYRLGWLANMHRRASSRLSKSLAPIPAWLTAAANRSFGEVITKSHARP